MSEQNIKNHPGIAAVLSFAFNGLGQVYNGQIMRGLVTVFIAMINMLILITGSVFIGLWFLNKIIFAGQMAVGLALFFIALISICIVGIYSILDAYKVAKKSA